jgi:hypothetical protein
LSRAFAALIDHNVAAHEMLAKREAHKVYWRQDFRLRVSGTRRSQGRGEGTPCRIPACNPESTTTWP